MITDDSAMQVAIRNWVITTGMNHFRLDGLGSLQSGLYMLNLRRGGQVMNRKVVVVR